MKVFAGAMLALGLLLPTVPAQAYYHGHGGYYTNVDGRSVHRPVFSNHRLAGSTAVCRDGSQSFSRHHRGTCSHHGGVRRFR